MTPLPPQQPELPCIPEHAAVHGRHEEPGHPRQVVELISHHVRDNLVRLLNLSGSQRVAVLVESVGDEAGGVEDSPQETHSQEEQ